MNNPLLDELIASSVIPQVEIALPTRGYFYLKGEVLDDDVDPDEMPIRPISVLDESTFNDPLMMLSGHAISKMVNRVCRGVLDPSKMCELDIQAVLIASRIASHGSDMDIDHACPSCKEENRLQIDLNDHIMRFGSYTPDQFAEFGLLLPRAQQKVMLRPMLYGDTVDMAIGLIRASTGPNQLSGSTDETLSEKFIETYKRQFEETIKTNISAVSSSIFFVETKSGKKVYDRDMIAEWLNNLPTDDVRFITSRIAKINDDIRDRAKMEYQCQKCGTTNGFYLELDPQRLFMPAERSVTPKESSAVSKPTEKSTKKQSKTSRRLS